MADKSNAMQQGHALWQRVFKEVAAQYPGITATHQYIDAMAMFLVKDPGQYQVIVTNNLFGDIITDIGGALQGGLAWPRPATSIPGKTSLFEPVHGSAPPLAGKNVANPIGADPVDGADARNARRARRSEGHRDRRRSRDRRRPDHGRHRRLARHTRKWATGSPCRNQPVTKHQ